jgi:large subunit ribosomal protein L1
MITPAVDFDERQNMAGKNGKRYTADARVANDDQLPLSQAVERLKGFRKTKFDQTVELVMHLGIDPKQADQALRGSISLPHGVGGAEKRVIAFCAPEKVDAAKAAGAIEAGGEDLVKKIEDGWMDFDVAIAEPAMMRVAARLGKVLGPKGLMPSPKAGTVDPNVADAVKAFVAGKVEYRNDDGGNIHVPVGKHSFDPQQLVENAEALINHITKIKPASTKGQYIKKVAITATMTPSVLVAV